MAPSHSTVLQVVPELGEPFTVPFAAERMVIGRSSDADLTIQDGYLSRRHAELFRDGGRVMVRDLGSVNGTRVNGRRIGEPTPLADGDQIQLSASSITFRSEGAEPQAPAASPLDSLEGTVFLPADQLADRYAGRAEDSAQRIDYERQSERLAILNEVHRALAAAIELPDLLGLILDRAFDHLQPEQAAIFLGGVEEGWQRVASRETGDADEHLYSTTLVRHVAEKGMAALVHDAQSDGQFAHAESIMASGVRSLIAAPLTCPDGPLGMIACASSLERRQFDEGHLELLSSLASVAALRIWSLSLAEEAAERRRMASELELARRIQTSLLPEKLPELPGYELEAMNVPSRVVSGDSYQVLLRADGAECVLFLADVSGKGMAASLLTATLEALAAAPIGEGRPPREIFNLLSRLLEERTPPEKYATAFLAVLDAVSGAVTYASAGHNPALLVRVDGAVEELARTGIPLGLLPDVSYEERRVELAAGDTLVLYTDGITEAAAPDGEEFELERLAAVCRDHRAAPLPGLLQAIEDELDRFLAGEEFPDDRTVVALRRAPSSKEPSPPRGSV